MGGVTVIVALSLEGSGRHTRHALLREQLAFVPCPGFLCLCWPAARLCQALILAQVPARWKEILAVSVDSVTPWLFCRCERARNRSPDTLL